MTRAEFWGRKILLADPLGLATVRNLMNAASPEIVSKKHLEGGVTLIEFVDGSFLKASPVDAPGNNMGLVEWTN
jgi:hypothetical protein